VSDPPQLRGAHAAGGIPAARRALVEWIDAAGGAGRTFLQVRLLRTGQSQYEIRHARDVHRSILSLETVTSDPYAARFIAQMTNGGEHRPLKTAPSLRQGWALVDLDPRALWTALDYLYPACALHWHAELAGTLRVTHWREVAGRQSGMYGAVKLLPPDVVRNTVRACCADAVCVRRVAWEVDEAAAAGTLGSAREGEFSEGTNSRRMRYLALRLAEEKARIGDLPAPELPCEGCPKAVPCRGCPMV
jgi:hypothetical protein